MSYIREGYILIHNSGQADQISSLQIGIIKYLDASQFASWNILGRSIGSLYITLFDESSPSENLEYKVLYPLLRIGVIETARRPETGKLVYCLGPHSIIEIEDNHAHAIEVIPAKNLCRKIDQSKMNNYGNNKASWKDSLTLLKVIPSLQTVITHWETSETEVYYIYEKFEKNHFKTARDTSLPNIYTNRDKIYSNKYIKIENGMLYLIPEIQDNIDGFNIAHCYLEIIKRHLHFTFNRNTKELICWTFHSMLPIIICRALILCDPLVLLDGRLYSNGNMTINNITDDHVKELIRIFGETAVEVKDD
jgi:hypothetical protein